MPKKNSLIVPQAFQNFNMSTKYGKQETSMRKLALQMPFKKNASRPPMMKVTNMAFTNDN